MKIAISAPRIFDGELFLEDHAVLVDQGRVFAVVALGEIPSEFQLEEHSHGTLAPGFIDWQVNGGGGVLFNNETTQQGLKKILKGHYTGGTTSMLPTIVSDTFKARKDAATAVKSIIQSGEKSVLGLHLEGPFFCAERRGIHAEKHLSDIADQEFEWLVSLNGFLVLLTLAPEMIAPGQIKTLTSQGIVVCAGHTNANSSQIGAALSEGLRGFTHLYNAMRPATGREPGVVGSALVDQTSWCGIIVDGHHVHPDMVRLAYTAKPQKLCLVTDAMATVGSDTNSFELYGNTITEQDGRLINSEGRLAGSVISMIDAVRNCHLDVGISLSESLRMASLYPAQFLGVDHKLGLLKQDYRADLVHFNSDFKVSQTWVAGEAML